jgi:L-ribulokinase
MQLTADITGRPVRVAESRQTPALGSAMFAAVAAGPALGGYESILEASSAMARLGDDEYLPTAAAQPIYDDLYEIYRSLHDSLGAEQSEMRRLHSLQERVRSLTPQRTKVEA